MVHVRLISGSDADAARVIPWRRPYGALPVEPAAVAQAVADLIDTATDTARHGAELLAEVAPGDWRPGRAHLASACRPRVDPAAPRVLLHARISADAQARLAAEALRAAEPIGRTIDRLAMGLPQAE